MEGPPEFRVGLKPISASAWLAPDLERASLEDKNTLIDARRDEVFRALPGAEAAQEEVERLICEALCVSPSTEDAPALLRAARLVSDDLVVMMREGEAWNTRALCLCSPTFFSAEEAIGKSLEGLHGPVPDRLGPNNTQGMAFRIARMFEGLRDGVVLERFNWTVQASDARFTPDGAPLRALASEASEQDARTLLHLRVERQTIRLMPQTGAVLFTIRIALDPLEAVFAVEGAKEALAHAWRHAPDHVRAYKKWAAYERLAAAAFA
jgi:hypothetical protein